MRTKPKSKNLKARLEDIDLDKDNINMEEKYSVAWIKLAAGHNENILTVTINK
jgi:hypothetical protein